VARAYGILAERIPHVECLVGYEGDAFAASGDAREDLLSITAVHPLRRSAVRVLLQRCGEGWEVVDELVREGRLVPVEHAGESFLVRRFRREGSTADRSTATLGRRDPRDPKGPGPPPTSSTR
jgi:hypothetical protein